MTLLPGTYHIKSGLTETDLVTGEFDFIKENYLHSLKRPSRVARQSSKISEINVAEE